jgi:hypothetical protein
VHCPSKRTWLDEISKKGRGRARHRGPKGKVVNEREKRKDEKSNDKSTQSLHPSGAKLRGELTPVEVERPPSVVVVVRPSTESPYPFHRRVVFAASM